MGDNYLEEKYTNAAVGVVEKKLVVTCPNCHNLSPVKEENLGRIGFCNNCGCPIRQGKKQEGCSYEQQESHKEKDHARILPAV